MARTWSKDTVPAVRASIGFPRWARLDRATWTRLDASPAATCSAPCSHAVVLPAACNVSPSPLVSKVASVEVNAGLPTRRPAQAEQPLHHRVELKGTVSDAVPGGSRLSGRPDRTSVLSVTGTAANRQPMSTVNCGPDGRLSRLAAVRLPACRAMVIDALPRGWRSL